MKRHKLKEDSPVDDCHDIVTDSNEKVWIIIDPRLDFLELWIKDYCVSTVSLSNNDYVICGNTISFKQNLTIPLEFMCDEQVEYLKKKLYEKENLDKDIRKGDD